MTIPPTRPSKAERRVSTVALGLLALGTMLLASWSFFHDLGGGSLNDWDEATYGQIAREMNERRDWLTLFWNGEQFFDKPPLVFWLMAFGLKHLDVPELAVRWAPALAGLLAIGLTGLLGHYLFNAGTGIVAALLLTIGSSKQGTLVGIARHGMLDAPFTALTVWALIHFWLGRSDRRHWWLLGLPIGLAILVRGIGVVTIFLVIGGSLVALRLAGERIASQQWRALAAGLLLAAVIAVPWHLAETVRHGAAFLRGYILLHATKMTTEQQGAVRDWEFYLPIVRRALPGWWWLAPPALAFAGWRAMRGRDPRALFLLVWALVPLTFYSVAATQLPWYVMPILPALALLAAWLVWQAMPSIPVVQVVGASAILVAVAAWNARAIKPEDTRRAEKRVGGCVSRLAGPDETVGFFAPLGSNLYVRPSVRFYAGRPMHTVHGRPELAEWLARGGRLVWTDTAVVAEIADLLVPVAREGNQQLLRRRDWSSAPPYPEQVCGSLPLSARSRTL
jgi:4-amino-4-deoxy-L-arabinose transferase-like glycosyltransferase